MLKIAGGIYKEFCFYPEWNQIYGSGLRAAAGLSHYCAGEIRLSSFVSDDEKENIQAIASSFGINLVCVATDATVSFSYFHGLSVPYIYPNPNTISSDKSINVEGEAVLRFGFIEGSAIVKGNRVVYDPQSPSSPIPFAKNGSQAKELAVVANRREAVSLSGCTGSDADLAVSLKQKEKATVAVVKLGPKGCVVIDKDDAVQYVPAYETNFVWPIGSGDVFSAFFAYAWTELHLTPVEAAYFASKATACYCGRRSLPIPKGFESSMGSVPVTTGKPVRKKVYLAGPFFNMGQRWLIEEARSALLACDVDVFSPLHEAGSGPAKEVYGPDIAGLEACDILVACLDGLDAGTIYEIGYAKAKGKPVIAYANSEPVESLKMIEGGGCVMTDDFCTAIYKTVWAAMRI